MTPKTKQFMRKITSDERQLGLVLTPSYASGFIAVVIGLIVTFGAMGVLHYKGSSWQRLFQEHHNAQSQQDIAANYPAFSEDVSQNTFLSNAPLFVFWAGIGLILYTFSNGIFNSLRSVKDMEEEMNYVNVSRHALRREFRLHLLVRIAILALWILYTQFTIHILVPYAIAVAYAASGPLGLPASILYSIWAIFLLFVGTHLHVVLLRLLLLRPRLFGDTFSL